MTTLEQNSLEAVELEFALGAQDVLMDGFAGALTKAADMTGGKVLFNMPALDTSHAQRIGAIALNGAPDSVFFVSLLNDGITLSMEALSGDNHVFESLGRNFAAVMQQLDGSS